MFGLDPRLMAIIAIVFIGLGIFNLYLGRDRLLKAQGQGQPIVWYKQVSILTGIEYVLLAVVLLLRMAATYNWFPVAMSNLVVPTYTFILLLSAVVLGAMLYQGIKGSRFSRTLPVRKMAYRQSVEAEPTEAEMTSEQRLEYTQKRRERRHKSAAARRKRTGRA